MPKKQRDFAPTYWVRSNLRDDINADSRVTHTATRFFEKLLASYSWKNGYAECADTFIDRDIPISLASIKRARKLLCTLERIWIIRRGGRRGVVNLPTRYGIALYYRGSDRFRELSGGEHAVDFRTSTVTMPNDYHLAGRLAGPPQGANDDLPKVSKVRSQGIKSAHPRCHGDPQTHPLTEDNIGAPKGARPVEGAQGGAKKEESAARWHASEGGRFAKWRIVHAEYVGKKGADDDEKDVLLAHLRSARGAKFTLRCHIDSDEYASLDDALGVDGEPERLANQEVMMSTGNAAKTFRRSAPLPWCEVTILSGESDEDGSARVRVEFHDNHGGESTMNLSAEAAAALAAECGGEDRSVGSRVRYRIMPDDSYEWRLVVAASRTAA